MAATNVVCTVCVTLGGSVVIGTGSCCVAGAGAGLTFSTCICDDASKGGSGFSGSADDCVVTGGVSLKRKIRVRLWAGLCSVMFKTCVN